MQGWRNEFSQFLFFVIIVGGRGGRIDTLEDSKIQGMECSLAPQIIL